jgi:hypothetical protein
MTTGKAGKCGHRNSVIKYDCDGLPDPLELSWRVCLDCGHWLSLGPANDRGPEVAIELRAAEIAAGLEDGGCDVSMLEQCGFNDTLAPLRGGGFVSLDSPSVLAGYLAHCIVTHGASPSALNAKAGR